MKTSTSRCSYAYICNYSYLCVTSMYALSCWLFSDASGSISPWQPSSILLRSYMCWWTLNLFILANLDIDRLTVTSCSNNTLIAHARFWLLVFRVADFHRASDNTVEISSLRSRVVTSRVAKWRVLALVILICIHSSVLGVVHKGRPQERRRGSSPCGQGGGGDELRGRPHCHSKVQWYSMLWP